MGRPETFADVVRRQFAFLANDHGFRLVSESADHVRLESQTLGAEASCSPRGEIELSVFRLGHEEPFERWTCGGMVGRASIARVLEIAGERLRADEAVLRGDRDYFERLNTAQKLSAENWTAYYSGFGPRPDRRKLP